MPWSSWDEREGELSARDRLIAILAFKIGTNQSLTEQESVVQLCELPDDDVFAVLKMVALFNYWQQLTDALIKVPDPADAAPVAQLPLDPSPYFHEGNPPPTNKAKTRESHELSRGGFVPNRQNGFGPHH
jgi:hypothetical protein